MVNGRIGFIGIGNMACAIINGMLNSKIYNPCDIFVFDLDENKRSAMKLKGINICTTSLEVANKSEYIILAIKPQNYNVVLEEIKDSIDNDHVMVSIAAGISIDFIKSYFNATCSVVRVMPNTPLLLGQGATAICGCDNIPEDKLKIVYDIFSASGMVEFLTEDKMNAVISINGSSPAYIYLFVKSMLDYAETQGIDYQIAMNLICKTLQGSADMIIKSGKTLDELIKMVSSPGGTTLEALKVLEENKFHDLIIKAMKSCTLRAEELSK